MHGGVELDACMIALNSCECVFFADIFLLHGDCFYIYPYN